MRRAPEIKQLSSACTVYEYGVSSDGAFDTAMAVMTDRYPASGDATNSESCVVVRVLKGMGAIAINGRGYELHIGDEIEVGKGQPYHFDVPSALTVLLTSSPPWTADQYSQQS